MLRILYQLLILNLVCFSSSKGYVISMAETEYKHEAKNLKPGKRNPETETSNLLRATLIN